MEIYLWELACSVTMICMKVMRGIALATLTCCFTACGAVIGSISGAVKGQTTETGLVRGVAIGVVAGAVVSLEVMESCLQGQLLSKVGIFSSLLNGKIFREWVSPAMLKAYQWQVNALEDGNGDIQDFFDTERSKGLSPNIIKMLPMFKVGCSKSENSFEGITCAVCLQDLNEGEGARKLPDCRHIFHMTCIDGWLVSHASCPICRQDMLDPFSLHFI